MSQRKKKVKKTLATLEQAADKILKNIDKAMEHLPLAERKRRFERAHALFLERRKLRRSKTNETHTRKSGR